MKLSCSAGRGLMMYFNPARLGSVVTPRINEAKQNKSSTFIVYFFYFQPVGIALPYCFVIVFVSFGEWHVYAGMRFHMTFLIIYSHPCWAYNQFYSQAIMLHAFYLSLPKNRLSKSSYQFHYLKNTFIFALKKLLKVFEWN